MVKELETQRLREDRISSFEKQYMSALRKIYTNGYSDGVNERTGHETKRLPGIVFQIDAATEVPILRSKKVYWESAEDEIQWIMQRQSNNIHDLKPHIWDAWADEDGSIGKAYGYQIGQPMKRYINKVLREHESQVHSLLAYLEEEPQGRHGVLTLWNPRELSEMNLCPCCHTSTWNLDGGKLNCVLDQRSGDMPVGVPFNTLQYVMLMHMFAKHLGVDVGIFTHVIADAHIYDNQMDLVKLQLDCYDVLLDGKSIISKVGDPIEAISYDEFDSRITPELRKSKKWLTMDGKAILMSTPCFNFKEDVKDFFNNPAGNLEIVNYISNDAIPYPVVS